MIIFTIEDIIGLSLLGLMILLIVVAFLYNKISMIIDDIKFDIKLKKEFKDNSKHSS